ncbi:hypothetical protein [Clostridium septicum]|uniref:Uncharacterized protein n=1 Tax=Clostridium septicum TaxID=1504 RepID=A0ABY5AYL8_CLOSE|nr:hypothetical protein [Clostridium septicum]MDU1314821.1 hypothetical protein [Clostridium septicum]UEC21594.1 hypothetical protein LK444_04275 [Clostridium septicum]USS00358.1 hypothetical protein NH397_12805 [Clostridium septicum]
MLDSFKFLPSFNMDVLYLDEFKKLVNPVLLEIIFIELFPNKNELE